MKTTLTFATLSSLALAAALGIACGKEKATTPPPDAQPATATSAAPADGEAPASEQAIAWESMTHEQKAQHMKKVVTPKMAEIFRSFSAEHFAEFNCTTCHGPGAKEGQFEMPSAALPPLTDFDSAMKEHPEVTKFMAEKVVPEMANALGVAPYNPETHEGLGCFACHTKKG
jgi:hypothetical protein